MLILISAAQISRKWLWLFFFLAVCVRCWKWFWCKARPKSVTCRSNKKMDVPWSALLKVHLSLTKDGWVMSWNDTKPKQPTSTTSFSRLLKNVLWWALELQELVELEATEIRVVVTAKEDGCGSARSGRAMSYSGVLSGSDEAPKRSQQGLNQFDVMTSVDLLRIVMSFGICCCESVSAVYLLQRFLSASYFRAGFFGKSN